VTSNDIDDGRTAKDRQAGQADRAITPTEVEAIRDIERMKAL
jgi:hypothetical protein